jgi:hypothetical protein
MLYRRLLLGTPVLAGAAVLLAGPAFADTVTGTVSPSQVKQGGSVNFCGSGFTGGSDVVISVNSSPVQDLQADNTGAFCLSLKLDTIGTDTLTATGVRQQEESHLVTATVVVTAAPSPSPSPSPTSTPPAKTPSPKAPAPKPSAAKPPAKVLGTSVKKTSLPFTGAPIGAEAAAGALLIGGGLMLRYAGRRRATR